MDKQPIFDPANDWGNIQKWMERDDAKRTQLMRLAVREELKPVVPFMNRVGRLEVIVLILGIIDVGTLIFLVAQKC